MESILNNIGQVLGMAVIHSLWQALIIYFLLRIALLFSARASAATRYTLAVTALFAITGWFVYTLIGQVSLFNWLKQQPLAWHQQPAVAFPAAIGKFNDVTIRYYYNIEGYLPYISLLYAAGLVYNSSRLLLLNLRLQAVKRGMSMDIALQRQADRFADTLGIVKKIAVGLTDKVDVPCMAGYLKPVILLPFSLATLLSTEEIESILLHELAHIRRNDYLVNLLQQVIAILLFFNPCAILVNRIINEERENSCDDLVVKATANPLIYAKALLKAEQIRQSDQKLALAATGKKYHLLNRVQRIMKTKQNVTAMRPTLAAMLILTFTLCGMAVLKPEITHGAISVRNLKPAIASLFQADTNHKKTVAVKKYHHTAIHKKPVISDADYEKKMDELNAEVQKYSNTVSAYYQSEDFKKLQTAAEALGKEMEGYCDKPEVKQQEEELGKLGQAYQGNAGDNKKQADITKQMSVTGGQIGAYFGSPAFQKLDREERVKFGIPLDKHEYDEDDQHDENYRKYHEDLESKLPTDIREKTRSLERMGKEMSARYETPEFKARSKRMQELGDSISKAYQSPEVKEKQAELDKLVGQISAYQNNPEIKRQQQLLNAAAKRMADYVNSHEYQNYLKVLKNMNFNFNYNDNNNSNDNEKPEKPENQ